ncbi:MAG TPA: DUF4175 family protein, partial [Candidatus Glassbacteria bacterium]|nr:DUF4175 family protein [Candidatus Glassbacteria bacterium]
YRHPLELLARERSFHIVVQPGNAVLLRGDSLLVRAVGSIHRPGQMTLNFWQAGEARQSLVMQYRPGQFEYTCTFSGLQNDIRYFVQQAGTATDTFLVQVTNNPFVTELSITYQYPPYTGLADFTTTRDKAIQGLRGTRMILDGHSSNTLAQASLVLSPDSLRPLPLIGGRSFTDTLVLAHDGSYGIRLTDTWGLTNDDTLHYPITVVPDEAPAVALRFPGQNAQIDEAMKQPLVFELADDYGVLKLEIEYAKMASDGRRGETRRKRIALWSGENRTHFIDQYLWELSDLNLLPEDEVAYKLIVYDNDRVSGPKATASDEFRVRFPSLEEIFTREQQRQDDITTSLETLEERGEKFRQQVKELNEAIERGKNLEWEQNQQLDQTLTDQKKMLDQVKNIADQLQQSIDQMQRGQMMTVEMMEKMARVQSLLEEVANDRVKQLMTQLQQSIDKLDRRAVADALRQLQISQEQILQKLDKTLALLENLKLEQQMDYLVQKSEEIAQAARQLADTSAALLGEKPSPADSSASDTRDASGSESQKQKSQEYSDSTRNQERSRQAESPVENRQFPQGEMKSGQPNSRSQQAEQGRPGQPENIGEDKQRELGEKAGEIGEQTEDLFERLAETAKGMQIAQEEELAQKLQQEGSPENRQFFSNSLNRIGNNLMSGRLRQSLSQEQEFAGGMQKMNQRLEQYRDELTEKWQKKVAEAMKRAFDELGYLSESQEEIMLAVDAEPDFTHPDILRYAAREQEVVAGLESVLTGVTEAAKDNFFIS